MNIAQPKILVIDDLFDEDEALYVELMHQYGEENVHLRKDSKTGLQYINDHLTERLVVLLDYHLGSGSLDGNQVLKKIRRKTSLIFTIIMTAHDLHDIDVDKYVELINNQALAFIKKTDGDDKILQVVAQAVHSLDNRVDCILEEWLNYFPDEERKKPYMTMPNDVTYSIQDIMNEIRMGSDIGKMAEKGIIKSAIDLIVTEE